MPKMLRRTLTILAVVLVLLTSALAIIGTLYEDDVKAALIGAMNRRLTAPVTVGEVDLTLLRRFPHASLHLQHVLAQEAYPESTLADTLAYADDLYLEFSLWDLFTGNYRIDRIHGEHVLAYPGMDAEGRENWRIWTRDTTSNDGRIDLDHISFDHLLVRYHDDARTIAITGRSQRLDLRGTLADRGSELLVEGDAHLMDWLQGTRTILAERQADVRLKMTFGGADGVFRIIDGALASQGVQLTTTLQVGPEKDGPFIDLRAAGKDLDLAELMQLLPPAVTDPLRAYELKGETDVVARYSGAINGTPGPQLFVQMALREGKMKERNSRITFDRIAGHLDLTLNNDGGLAELNVKGLQARSGSGELKGELELRGAQQPHVKARMNAHIGLADLLRFARVDTLEQVEGRLVADLQLTGAVRSWSGLKAADLRALAITGNVGLKDAALKMKGLRHRISGVNAEMHVQGGDAEVRGLTADLQGSHLTLTGTLHDLVPYLLLDGQKLTIAAKLRTPRIDLGALLADDAAPGGGGPGQRLSFPKLLALDIDAQADELVMEDFRTTEVRGHLSLKDKRLTADPITFHTANGMVSGRLAVDGRDPDRFPMAIQADLKGIDISALFAEFRDFGQDFIGHQHIRGTTDAKVDLRVPLDPTLHLDLDGLTSTVDIAIDHGELKDHRPLMQVADYVKKNKLIAPFVDARALQERLADVHFERLENRIEIRDRQVIIPLMAVKSTALDIEMSGRHGFDDRLDHHMNFRLGDLLRNGPMADEFGPIVDDGTGFRVFLHMYGPANDPTFENDNAMAAARRGRKWQEEKQELKAIFRDDLGLGRRTDDRTATAAGGAPPPTTFEVEWDDADSTAAPTTADPPKKKRKDKEDGSDQVRFEVIP
ncbi:MAG: hypothetical protein H6595_05500 [Flavobacteriales bacterium]|nr:hypothetical protein [Flavobacteriales bacterium]MCB9166919.1 hypothetical protein [Flavobacteriales bacterium]